MNNYINESNRIPNKEHIQIWINEILDNYKQTVRSLTPPICERTLCKVVEKLKGISITIEPDNKASVFDEGLLLPMRGGFIIKYGTLNKNQIKFHKVKTRETICHELAHILFYDCTSLIPQLQIISDESLCHDIARQLLLPAPIVEKEFKEKIKIYPTDLVQVIKELSRHFQVAIMLMVRRLTEDLSLLKDSMVTFWEYKEDADKQIPYEHDPKLSPELKRLLPKYWRDRIHVEAWTEAISKVAINGCSFYESQTPIHIEGKSRRKGKVKSISFKIQCAPLYDSSKYRQLRLEGSIEPVQQILSIERFDLNILENGK
jgi:Zn-dependent peptidase ImmA (M78 family)